MPASRHFYNEKLPTRTELFFRLLFVVMITFAMPIIGPFLKPRVFSGSGAEWFLAAVVAAVIVIVTMFERVFVSVQFDYEKKEVNITSRTILDPDKTTSIPFANLSYREDKEGSLRKAPTKVLELLNRKRRIIKLKAKSIGEYTFNEIVKEISALKNPVNN